MQKSNLRTVRNYFSPTFYAIPGGLAGWLIAQILAHPFPSWNYLEALGGLVIVVALMPIIKIVQGKKKDISSLTLQLMGWSLVALASASINSGLDNANAQWNATGVVLFVLFFLVATVGYGVKNFLDTPKANDVDPRFV